MPAKSLPSSGITVRAAADALDVTRQALEERIKKGNLVPLDGTDPLELDRSTIASEVQARLHKARTHLAVLERGAEALGVADARAPRPQELAKPTDGTPANPASPVVDDLQAALSEAHVGRALAEAKIDELKAAVRQLNAAVDALKPQPDFDPDIVR